ncbi:MAG: (Fe-S)-binding protein [Vicinamibacteria bacterium]
MTRTTRTPHEEALYAKTLACVHCGLCLPACPAYGALGRESVAPRGQVYNVRALLEGRLVLTDTLANDIYDCLTCRACESVCPAGVPVGSIMEDVRGLITDAKTESWLARAIKKSLLGGVVAHPKRLAWVVGLLRFYQASGLRRVVRASLRFLPGTMVERESLLPNLPPRDAVRPLPPVLSPRGSPRKRVGLFTGCIASHFFADVNGATARVLQRNGFEVVIPRDQGCCGALHLHNGLPELARKLARANLKAFQAVDVANIVVNAAGCGAALSEYDKILDGDPRAKEFALRVADISQFLVREGFEPPRGKVEARVAYDEPCHLLHAQKVHDEPYELLRSIPGVSLQSFRDAERCCGSAGIYNLTHYDISMAALQEKMRHLAAVAPDIIVSGNPGCLMQLRHGVRRSGLEAEVTHPVVLLDRAYMGASDRG